jgi:hypothetical protein
VHLQEAIAMNKKIRYVLFEIVGFILLFGISVFLAMFQTGIAAKSNRFMANFLFYALGLSFVNMLLGYRDFTKRILLYG